MSNAPTQRQLGFMHRLIKEKGIDEEEFYLRMGFKEATLWGNQIKEYKITKPAVSRAIDTLLKMDKVNK